MLIAILSDSHDQILHLQRAVQHANRQGAGILIHCGDLISPFMLPYLAEFNGQVHLIYGNNVGDQHLISSRCETQIDNIRHHGIFGAITVNGLQIAFHHYPELACGVAETGKYDIVCCGHNHVCAVQKLNGCLLLNPGDLLGKDNPPGFLLVDTSTMAVRHIIVGDAINFETKFTPISQSVR